jgi:hypothetical protein
MQKALRIKTFAGLFFLVLAISTLILPTVARAIVDPDQIQIISVKVFQNLWETGDQLYFIEYNVEYATEPTEDAADTYAFQVYSSAGTTLLKQTPLNYYQVQIVSLYLTPSESLVWGSSYQVRIGGNVAVPFPSGTPEIRRSLSSTDWIAGDEDASRTLLGVYILQRAADLENKWLGVITLLTTDDRLNSTGSVTFGEAVPGLIDICPSIFETAAEPMDVTISTTVPTAAQTQMTAAMSARLQTALNDLGAWIGVPGEFVGGVGLAIIFFILAGRIFTATNSVTIAMVASIPLILLANMIGLLPIAITWAATIVVIVIFAIVFILGRLA